MEKKYTFFWNGVFSNWHRSIFKVDGVTFSSGEQYFMYMKVMCKCGSVLRINFSVRKF